MIIIKPLLLEHWPEVERIYIQGIDSKNATFETQAPSWEKWNENHREDTRLVAIKDNRVLGWAALSKVSTRFVFRGVAEISIYIDTNFHGLGIGNALMDSLIALSEKNGVWSIMAGIFPENKISLHLHEKFGFRYVGTREKMGQMQDGAWRDVVILERRSKIVGV